jgi:dolichol kinase
VLGSEDLRRSLHLLLGAGAYLLPWLGWRAGAVLCAVAAIANTWILPHLAPTRVLLRPGNDGRLGLILYPAVLGVLLLVFRDDYLPTRAGWLAMAVGDGIAPWLGRLLPRPRWPWLPGKSLSASAAASTLAAATMLPVMPPAAAGAAALGGLAGEALSGIVDDNLSVPALAAICAWGVTGGVAA